MAEQQSSGMTALATLDKVSIRQKTTFVQGNKYVVVGPEGGVVLYAREETSVISQLLGGNNRAFNIDVYDAQHELVMKLRRPYTFGPDKMEVWVLGELGCIVRQKMTFVKPVLSINTPEDQTVLRVKGPVITTGDCDFHILSPDKKRVGVISKKWGGVREVVADTDNFLIQFPQELDVRYKAAVVGTCFLIDFLYYEN